jgi:hypothetical protein
LRQRQVDSSLNWSRSVRLKRFSRRPSRLSRLSQRFVFARADSGIRGGPNWVHEIKFDGYRVIALDDCEPMCLWARTTSGCTEGVFPSKCGAKAGSSTPLVNPSDLQDTQGSSWQA